MSVPTSHSFFPIFSVRLVPSFFPFFLPFYLLSFIPFFLLSFLPFYLISIHPSFLPFCLHSILSSSFFTSFLPFLLLSSFLLSFLPSFFFVLSFFFRPCLSFLLSLFLAFYPPFIFTFSQLTANHQILFLVKILCPSMTTSTFLLLSLHAARQTVITISKKVFS